MKNILCITQWLSIILLLIFSFGCATIQQNWEKTEQINTIESYEKFIKHYPNGELAVEAQSRIEELDFQKTKDVGTIEAYETFLWRYPDGKLAVEVQSRIEELDFQETNDVGTIEACESFLWRYPDPNGKFAVKVQSRIEELDFQKTKDVGTIEACESFLKRYPNGKFSVEAQSRIEELDFQKTKDIGTIEACEIFLKRYPNGKFSVEVQSRIEELDFQKAKDIGDIEAYEMFIKRYPNGIFIKEANLKLKNLNEQIQNIEDTIFELLPGANVKVESLLQYPRKADLVISAHLYEGWSADNNTPMVKSSNATNKELYILAEHRCAKIFRSIFQIIISSNFIANLPDAGSIVINIRHGVSISYHPSGIPSLLLYRQEAQTIYQAGISLDEARKYDWSSISEDEIMRIFLVQQVSPFELKEIFLR
jgi:outer membrane protein assembly factor BamD (BamD/ComL family)